MVKLPLNFKERQSGQALLLILLVLSVVLTMVLSSVSRSVTDVDISKYEDSSIRAFDAAQAGIEKMIVGQAVSGGFYPLDNNASFTPFMATASATTSNYYRYPISLVSGESAIFYFAAHKQNAYGDFVMDCSVGGACKSPAQIRFCWGNTGTASGADTTPAIYLEFYMNSDTLNPTKWQNMNDLSGITVVRLTADPHTSPRSPANGFTVLPIGGAGMPCTPNIYQFSALFDDLQMGYRGLPYGALLFVKVTMLYNDIPQPLAVMSGSPLPSQGSLISSVGQYQDVYRKLVLYQGYPEIPTEFMNAIYSRSSLTK